MDDLITWLRAQLDAIEAATVQRRDGHEGPCLNYEGQEPADYSEYDSCYRHIATAEATPYRDSGFGLREVEAKREIIRKWEVDHGNGYPDYSGGYESALEDVIAVIAAPYSDRPGYREEWKP